MNLKEQLAAYFMALSPEGKAELVAVAAVLASVYPAPVRLTLVGAADSRAEQMA